MVNYSTRIPLPEEGTMSKALDYSRQFLYIVFGFIMLGFVLKFPNFCHATQKLLDRADSLNSVEIASVKISFNTENVTAAFSELKADNVAPAERSHALELIHGLGQDEFVRLMYVGQLRDLCEYDAPADTRMLHDVAADYKLAGKQLAKMVDNPEQLKRAMHEVNKQIAKSGHSDNGRPFHCYDMQLTEYGYNVKTALVGSFGEAFKSSPVNAVPSGPANRLEMNRRLRQ
jgi:hypothetical protein